MPPVSVVAWDASAGSRGALDLARRLREVTGARVVAGNFYGAIPDRPVSEEGGATLGDLHATETGDAGEDLVLGLRRETIRRAVRELAEPDREVIRLRCGIDGDAEPQTQAAVGRRLGLARTQVRAIEERALAQLARVRELDAPSEVA